MATSGKRHLSRRDIVGAAIGGAAALALHEGLTRGKRTRVSERDRGLSSEAKAFAVPKETHIVLPRTVVGVARCQRTARAKEMTFAQIKETVRTAVERAGGLKGIVRDGDCVVLKPNLMALYINSSGEKLYPEMNGADTRIFSPNRGVCKSL